MDTQNQNDIQPDYNFILNQGADGKQLADNSGATVPKNKKFLLLVAIAAIFLLALFGIIVSVSVNNGVERSDAAALATASSYLSYAAEGDYDAGYELLSPVTRPDKAFFAEQTALLAEKVDLSACRHEFSKEIENRQQVVVSCPRKDNGESLKLSFLVVSPNGVNTIMEVQPYVAAD